LLVDGAAVLPFAAVVDVVRLHVRGLEVCMNPSTTPARTKLDGFQKLALTTTAITYLLIGVGSFVRVSGAGLGCPDWPRCFGMWVPPTRAEQLPAGYDVTLFDPTLTWIEYVNRLLGALTGLFILATLIMAIVKYRHSLRVLVPSTLAFVGVLVAGWLGKHVIAHALAPWIVTVHLTAALGVVSLLLLAVVNAFFPTGDLPAVSSSRRWLLRAVWAVAGLTILQMTIGTQVRGTVEDIAKANPDLQRGQWVDHVGLLDIAHRNLALLVMCACGVLFLRAFTKHRADTPIVVVSFAATLLAASQIAVGIGLAYLSLPRGLQVLHLAIAALTLGALTVLGLLASRLPERPARR
jgi:cytochrome c oxidase assembly protein subunit 15